MKRKPKTISLDADHQGELMIICDTKIDLIEDIGDLDEDLTTLLLNLYRIRRRVEKNIATKRDTESLIWDWKSVMNYLYMHRKEKDNELALKESI